MATRFTIARGVDRKIVQRVIRAAAKSRDGGGGVGYEHVGGRTFEIFDLRDGEGWDEWTVHRAARRAMLAAGVTFEYEVD